MSTVNWGTGMAKVADHMEARRRRAQTQLDLTRDTLAATHYDKKTKANPFIDYLANYGLDEFESDFVKLYESMVLTTHRLDDEGFREWVERQFLDGALLRFPYTWGMSSPWELAGFADGDTVEVEW